MRSVEQQFSEALSITQTWNSVRKYSDPIPADLLVDIFSRVPANSIARFRCVSKFWSTILVRQDFTELFLTKSSTRPRLLFTFTVNGELFIYSSPQPQNPDKNSSLVATRYKHYPKHFPNDICRSLGGLVFLRRWSKKGRVICNPATGEFITLPKVKATGVKESYFGYDPINKQYKVLCMTWSRYGRPNTHRVLTLEAGKRLWRTIEDPIPPHYQWSNETCINGVLYYKAYIEGLYKIVCFDFVSEKFSFININEGMMSPEYHWTLFSYKGKLGIHHPNKRCFGGYKLGLWVLEDAGKHKWSEITLGRDIERGNHVVGMTDTGEIVFSPNFLSNPFYLSYYNIEKHTITKVNIQGFEEFKDHQVLIETFQDYVENMKFL